VFDAEEIAELSAVCEPPALVASWSAEADESASWSVSALWKSACTCPEPPHPAPQYDELSWDCSASWLVSASLYAEDVAVLSAVCEPPALVASWSASAEEYASWSVLAYWLRSCACPEPPQPASQLSLLDWSWSASWLVSASFYADE
jgi:hypothetical protein